jgi:hypothetical protein
MTRSPARSAQALAVAAACALLAVAGGAGCRARSTPPGGAQSPKAEHARKQLEVAALDAVKAAAESADRANPGWAARANQNPGLIGKVVGRTTASVPASTPAPPEAAAPPATAASAPPAPPAARGGLSSARTAVEVITERVSSVPYLAEADAEKDALEQAARVLAAKLAELDPPVRYTPSATEVKADFARNRKVREPTPEEAAALRDSGYDPTNRKYVEYDVIVTADQVRAMRSHERVLGGLRVVAGVAVAALAAFLFLRIDEWTKGYLTSWLALAAFGLAGGAAALLVFV